mmetsp:Transcript_143505/g.458895  ORF Transcript_143505/g.458895 Transcript_143505/m.458895 type:complete len:213 (-) Transcript_143505:83-721(-)
MRPRPQKLARPSSLHTSNGSRPVEVEVERSRHRSTSSWRPRPRRQPPLVAVRAGAVLDVAGGQAAGAEAPQKARAGAPTSAPCSAWCPRRRGGEAAMRWAMTERARRALETARRTERGRRRRLLRRPRRRRRHRELVCPRPCPSPCLCLRRCGGPGRARVAPSGMLPAPTRARPARGPDLRPSSAAALVGRQELRPPWCFFRRPYPSRRRMS